jgi:hypothetical protein
VQGKAAGPWRLHAQLPPSLAWPLLSLFELSVKKRLPSVLSAPSVSQVSPPLAWSCHRHQDLGKMGSTGL